MVGGDDQLWGSWRGAIAGCHCHCGVLCWGANFCFISSSYIQGHQFHSDTRENNNEFCLELLADVTLFSTLITQKLVLAIWGLCWYNFWQNTKCSKKYYNPLDDKKHEGQTKLVGKNRHDKNKKQTQSDRKQNITSATIWRKWNKALKQCKQRYYEKIFFHTFWSKTTTDWMWDMPLSNERWGLNVGRHDKTSISVNNIKERGTTVETHAQCSVLMSKKTN